MQERKVSQKQTNACHRCRICATTSPQVENSNRTPSECPKDTVQRENAALQTAVQSKTESYRCKQQGEDSTGTRKCPGSRSAEEGSQTLRMNGCRQPKQPPNLCKQPAHRQQQQEEALPDLKGMLAATRKRGEGLGKKKRRILGLWEKKTQVVEGG